MLQVEAHRPRPQPDQCATRVDIRCSETLQRQVFQNHDDHDLWRAL